MYSSVNLLTQQNWDKPPHLPASGNLTNYSDLHQVDFSLKQGRCAIKFVLQGLEQYRVNGLDYRVQSGEYLLINPDAHGTGWVDSSTQVQGICIHLDPVLMSEVAAARMQPGVPHPVAQPWEVAAVKNDVYRGKGSRMSQLLQQFGTQIQSKAPQAAAFPTTFYYTLCELYLGDVAQFSRQLTSIQAVKSGTKQELYRRLMKGRDFMEDSYTQPMEVADIARVACLSEYQFFRLFKAVFGQTPYQYLLQKRLDLGWQMLHQTTVTVSDAALQTGFADIFSFSKAFKKRFGVSPSSLVDRAKIGRN
jgi:AraC family transcriptional regulator